MDQRPAIRAFEEVKITYGEHSNGYLLQEYGFTTKDNPFDFVRKVGVTIETVLGSECESSAVLKSAYEKQLAKLNLKEKIQVDLKLAGLNRDLLKLIRSYFLAKNQDSLDWS